MNNFCTHLRLFLSQRFNIDVDVYVSIKKLVHISLVKPLFSYRFFPKVLSLYSFVKLPVYFLNKCIFLKISVLKSLQNVCWKIF